MHVHPETPDPSAVLSTRLDALERRVTALERSVQTADEPAAAPSLPAASLPSSAQASSAAGEEKAASGALAGVLSLFGAALLGIAGAYVLRAIGGANLVPRGLVAGVAAIYATGWLLGAVRSSSRQLAASLFAVTSILILAPMLWEMSIRFEAMSALGAAGYLAAYTALAMAVGYRHASPAVFVPGVAGAALTATALCIGTHSMAMFTLMLLAMHAVCELTPLRDRAHGVRILVALCADLSVWAILRVYPLAPGDEGGYPALSAAAILAMVALLFAIELAGIVIALRGAKALAVLPLLQTVAALALLIFGMTSLMARNGAPAIGLLCLLLAASGYAAAYGPIRRSGQRRNFAIFAVWSCVLFYAAGFLLVPPAASSVFFALVGLTILAPAARMQLQSVEVQAVLFLATAAVASGLLAYAFSALAGHIPGRPGWPILLSAASIVFAYAVAGESLRETVLRQILHLLLALLAGLSVAALLARALVGLAAGLINPDVFHIAVLRTFAVCILAIALAWLGARLGRVQMTRVAYTALGFAAAKLLFEDLRHGRMEFSALSICLVALTFLSVPRLARVASHEKAAR